MANLSQLRRQRMLAFLEKMREQHKDDDEVLVAINEVENEINEKKYGLVWERHSEEVEERMVDEVPIFVEDKGKEITMTDNGYNFLLEGDNLHSLHLLEKTHKEKIDVIYIDPPYNTGNKDFIFDDEAKFVGADDAFRHSKWISFMQRRLAIARRLLSETGIILVSINDIECATLRLILDSVFGEENFIETFIWVKNSGGSLSKTTLTRHEYIICYAKNKEMVLDNDFFYMKKPGYDQVIELVESLRNSGATIKEAEKELRKFYKEHDELKGISLYGNIDENWKVYRCLPITAPNNNFYDVIHPITGKPVRTPPRGWSWSQETMAQKIAEGRVVFGKDESYVPSQKLYLEEANFEHKRSTINSDQAEGNKLLAAAIGADNSFRNSVPKPISVLNYLFQNTPRDGIILDFFAGSGTTGQAVMELNKEDGGNRHFILCTNNENNICDGVTYPRLKTVITGIRPDGSKYSDGIPSDLKYYHTDYIPKNSGTLAQDLIAHIDEMIQLEYGVKIDKEKYISILTDEDADELEKNWANYPNIRAIYISRHVLLTGKQKELFGTHDCFTIPDYYFREELREAGEA